MPKDMAGVMDEYKGGQLHSGSKTGPVVRNPKQAVAIGLSEQKALKGGPAAVSKPPMGKSQMGKSPFGKGRSFGGKR